MDHWMSCARVITRAKCSAIFCAANGRLLELMVNDITANVRLLIAERFPKQDLRRVVNEITRMCKQVARLGFSETPADTPDVQRQGRGVRV